MGNIMYYVLVDENTLISNEDKDDIGKVPVPIPKTTLPFSDEPVDLYLISHKKNECKIYIQNLNKDIQKHFHIKQVGSEIQYTAFIDVIGFSDYVKTKITNHDQAEEFYNNFNEIIEYLQSEQQVEFPSEYPAYLKDIKIKYSWVSDTFVICIEYLNEIKKNDENKIKSMMILRLSMIIASIHHFMASKFGFILRGAISSKYSCITNNFILGAGIVEAAKLEKEAIYPRVIFAKNIISDDIYELISLEHQNNDLNFISKDDDDYYFVNYLAILQKIPPMIGKEPKKIADDKIEEYSIEKKVNVLGDYQEIVKKGLEIQDKEIFKKYEWLNKYLGRVLLNESFQKNIINN